LFEQLLRPQLLATLSKPARELVPLAEMYAKLGRSDLLRQEYAKARPAPLHRQARYHRTDQADAY